MMQPYDNSFISTVQSLSANSPGRFDDYNLYHEPLLHKEQFFIQNRNYQFVQSYILAMNGRHLCLRQPVFIRRVSPSQQPYCRRTRLWLLGPPCNTMAASCYSIKAMCSATRPRTMTLQTAYSTTAFHRMPEITMALMMMILSCMSRYPNNEIRGRIICHDDMMA